MTNNLNPVANVGRGMTTYVSRSFLSGKAKREIGWICPFYLIEGKIASPREAKATSSPQQVPMTNWDVLVVSLQGAASGQ